MHPKTRKKFKLVILVGFLCSLVPPMSWADPKISIEVKTVLASSQGNYLDPQLSQMAEELKSLFRYTTYRLLTRDRLTLDPHQTGKLSLPGNRNLHITYIGIQGQRVGLLLKMFKNQNNVFETNIQLKNRSSIIVGGPRYDVGYLLFNIYTVY